MHDLVFYVVVVPRFWLDCTHLGVSTRTCKVYCNCKERNAVFMVQINVFMKKEGEKTDTFVLMCVPANTEEVRIQVQL